MRRAALLLMAVLAAALLVATVVVGHRAPSNTERVQHLSGELRCPTCVSQTVAGSDTPVAEGMRAEVARQVSAGRSDSQILSWFRQRYGEDIVLAPARHGLGALLWGLPAGALAIGAGVILWRRRTDADRRQAPAVERALPSGWLAAVLALAVVSGVAVPVAFSLRHHTGAADAASATPSPATAPSTAPMASPSAAADPVAAAFGLLTSGHPAAAEALVRGLADRPGRTGTLALLVLGLAQRAEDDPAATATLDRFLQEHPKHPAAAQVRRILHGS